MPRVVAEFDVVGVIGNATSVQYIPRKLILDPPYLITIVVRTVVFRQKSAVDVYSVGFFLNRTVSIALFTMHFLRCRIDVQTGREFRIVKVKVDANFLVWIEPPNEKLT